MIDIELIEETAEDDEMIEEPENKTVVVKRFIEDVLKEKDERFPDFKIPEVKLMYPKDMLGLRKTVYRE
jgi:hypothetical protein